MLKKELLYHLKSHGVSTVKLELTYMLIAQIMTY